MHPAQAAPGSLAARAWLTGGRVAGQGRPQARFTEVGRGGRRDRAQDEQVAVKFEVADLFGASPVRDQADVDRRCQPIPVDAAPVGVSPIGEERSALLRWLSELDGTRAQGRPTQSGKLQAQPGISSQVALIFPATGFPYP